MEESLQYLHEKTLRKTQLDAQLKEMRAQKAVLQRQLRELDAIREKEQTDAERLERRSLANFFYTVLGKKETMLQKEQQEALEATVRYENAEKSLLVLEKDLSSRWDEACTLQGVEQRYKTLLQQRRNVLRTTGTAAAEKLLQLEEESVTLQAQHKEIEEAVSAGARAQGTAQRLLAHLQNAHDWGLWDTFGGGMISDIAKYSALDEAQTLAEDLQVELHRFKAELAGVQISAAIDVKIESFLRFADFAFDNLFTDFAVLERIEAAQQSVAGVSRHIHSVQDKLAAMRGDVQRQLENVQCRIDEIVVQSERE